MQVAVRSKPHQSSVYTFIYVPFVGGPQAAVGVRSADDPTTPQYAGCGPTKRVGAPGLSAPYPHHYGAQ